MDRKRLLLVEDQEELRKLIAMTLQGSGYDVFHAANGDEALRRLASLQPEVVILDVMMRGSLDGVQVCEWMRSQPQHRNCCILMLSARCQEADRQRGMAAGADAYISKPFSPIELVETLNTIVKQRREQSI